MCLAIPGKVVEIDQSTEVVREGTVDFQGIRKNVNLTFVPEAKKDDYVLVHVGFAIGVIDEAEASKVFETLKALDGLDEAMSESPSDNQPRSAL